MSTHEIPQLWLVDDAEITREPSMKTLSESIHIDRKRGNKRAEAIEYFNAHNIPEIMNALISELLVQKPSNPLSFCVKFLRSATALATTQEPAPVATDDTPELLSAISDPSSREYILKHRLPWLFDDLLSNLTLEKPDDPHSFVLSWLRWNRSRYSDGGDDFDMQMAEVPHTASFRMPQSPSATA